MRIPLGVSFLLSMLALTVGPAEAACPPAGPKPVPGTLAAANAGCDAKPARARVPDETRRHDEPGVIRSGNTAIRMRGSLQMDVGTGGGMAGGGR
jgi:hypothetical protein